MSKQVSVKVPSGFKRAESQRARHLAIGESVQGMFSEVSKVKGFKGKTQSVYTVGGVKLWGCAALDEQMPPKGGVELFIIRGSDVKIKGRREPMKGYEVYVRDTKASRKASRKRGSLLPPKA